MTEPTDANAELMKAAVKRSRDQYKLDTSRAAFQAGAIFGSAFRTPQATQPQPVVPVWTPASMPPKEEDVEVLVRMADGRCEIAWATYWHGSSNAFAQWTFRDPDEDEQPVEWMHIPKHCATTQQPTQAQAGAVPLTDEELYDEKRSAIPQLFDLAQQWADNKIHSYQFANEAEKIVNAVARRVEAAHGIGIKGGQHGAE